MEMRRINNKMDNFYIRIISIVITEIGILIYMFLVILILEIK